MTLLLAQSVESLSGGAGWAGAGLLGLVLAWLLLRHLPSKDAQLKELLDAQAVEREKDREARHRLGDTLSAAIGQVNELHVAEMEKDRDRTEQRLSSIAKEFKDALDVILSHCQKDSKEIMAAFTRELDRVVREARHERT